MQEILETESTEIKPHNDLHFRLAAFEGPLDLLLHLIKEHKIDIYDIPIVEITKQYLDYLELMKELNLDIAGEFIVMAATLIYIKSKMLLPPDEEQAENPIEDPRAELVQRLLEYQAFKDASLSLREKEDIWKNIFRRMPPETEEFEDPGQLPFEASLFDLIEAFKKLLSKAPETTIEITRESLTVTDRINFIMETIEGKDGMKFEELFQETFSRLTLIVSFLALLEIIRLGLVKAYQDNAFGSIWIINTQRVNIMEDVTADTIEQT